MPSYADELLETARLLLRRRSGQRGRLPGARVRRSISTSYYALFHFLLEEASARVAGTGNDLRVRRRVLARTITHKGLKTTLDKVRGARINDSVLTFFHSAVAASPSTPPSFAQNLARVFIDAQTKRESADYDLNESLSETDARVLRLRVRRAIRLWREANTSTDRDFKHALAILMFLKGQLRQEV